MFRSSERLDFCRPESSDVRGFGLRNHYFWFFGGSAAGAKILICAAREGLPDVPTVRHKADSSYLGLHSTIIQLHVQYMYMVPGSSWVHKSMLPNRIPCMATRTIESNRYVGNHFRDGLICNSVRRKPHSLHNTTALENRIGTSETSFEMV